MSNPVGNWIAWCSLSGLISSLFWQDEDREKWPGRIHPHRSQNCEKRRNSSLMQSLSNLSIRVIILNFCFLKLHSINSVSEEHPDRRRRKKLSNPVSSFRLSSLSGVCVAFPDPLTLQAKRLRTTWPLHKAQTKMIKKESVKRGDRLYHTLGRLNDSRERVDPLETEYPDELGNQWH
jgi:hypothetical protein